MALVTQMAITLVPSSTNVQVGDDTITNHTVTAHTHSKRNTENSDTQGQATQHDETEHDMPSQMTQNDVQRLINQLIYGDIVQINDRIDARNQTDHDN